MNIFVLDIDPKLAARYHCQKHLVKMILEHCQLLSTAVHFYGERTGKQYDGIYKSTHKNHPSAIWARESRENYEWLIECTAELFERYSAWRGKIHKSQEIFQRLCFYSNIIPSRGLTPFPQAMPDHCKVPGDAVAAYRKYYVMEKERMCEWKDGPVPEWYKLLYEELKGNKDATV